MESDSKIDVKTLSLDSDIEFTELNLLKYELMSTVKERTLYNKDDNYVIRMMIT